VKKAGEARLYVLTGPRGQADDYFALVPQMLGSYYLFPLLIDVFLFILCFS